jgi:hypothetical protein
MEHQMPVRGEDRRRRAAKEAIAGLPVESWPTVAGLASQALDARKAQYQPEEAAQLAEAVLTLHAHGRTLVQACEIVTRESGHEVSPGLMRYWCSKSDHLGPMLDRARELCAEALAESTLAIADDGEDPARDRLRIDVRQRLAGQYDASRWAAKPAATAGAVAQASVVVQVSGDLAAVLASAGAKVDARC